MNRHIKKVAVLGSGVMGSRIACHFANIGVQVLLLDILPPDLKEEDKSRPSSRNALVNNALQNALKSNPSPIYHKSFAQRIQTGNFEDNLKDIADADWVIEVVVERLNIKQSLYERVEKYRRQGTLITSNTSGIPIRMLAEGRSEDFRRNFCGTHFFNPPRYLKLFEIIPSPETDREIISFLEYYAALFLGKTPVLAKDTPAFIANRIGVFSMASVFRLQSEFGLGIADIDSLTGTLVGKPKSATFRTADVVGIDTLAMVAKGVLDNCPDDESREIFDLPSFISQMISNNWLGDKTGQGFYKKTVLDGKKEILELDTHTLEYKKSDKQKYASVGLARQTENLKERLKIMAKGKDIGAEFLNKLNCSIFAYAASRIPEISDDVYCIDDAMRAGFGWELGPFEHWDVLGVEKTIDTIKTYGYSLPSWIGEMIAKGITSFYKIENGKPHYYDISTQSYKLVPGKEDLIILDNIRPQKPVYQNSGCTVHDIGDGVLCVEFQTKMNTIGGEILDGINKAIDIAERDGWKGVVLGNNAPNFSAGANLGIVLMQAIEQEWDELNFAIMQFQKTVMRIRYSSIPVVSAPHGLTLGGGCEISMHSDACAIAAETYAGLVEVGVGVIPGGGGTKEFALRLSDSFGAEDTWIPKLSERFTAIATAKTGTSAYEAFDIRIFTTTKDHVVIHGDRVIQFAKDKVLELYEAGYTMPRMREDILVLGRTGLAALYAGIAAFEVGQYASGHDATISKKLAYVLCGGDLSEPTRVSEQYLLDLEREAFLSLCGERKTMERMQSILTTGKPLRN